MSYKISEKDLGRIRLNEPDTAASVVQNIAIILSTRQQTAPLYRSFGLPMKFLDKPMPVAKPVLYAEVQAAIEEFEPRAEVVSITFSEDASTPGRLIPTVEVNIREQ